MSPIISTAFKLRTSYTRRIKQVLSPLADSAILSRPFRGSGRRILIIFEDNRISTSQIFPFAYYSPILFDIYNAELRFVQLDKFIDSYTLGVADIIILQTWFNLTCHKLDVIFQKIHSINPNLKIVYMDSFAPADLRLARILNNHIDLYIKKHLLTDTDAYYRSTSGDTNLTDYYGKLYNIKHDLIDWSVPPGFAEKVLIGPGFFTAPQILPRFSKPFDRMNEFRPIDIHARLTIKGSPWYSVMRQHALEAVKAISGITAMTEPGVSLRKYMKELYNSKLCFSPFGYGEVCWRDVEAIMTGSLLIKPDMSHLRTDPNIFIPYETYVPISWDFSDLEEKVDHFLNDNASRRKITENAYNMIREYLINLRFVEQMRPVFSL